MTQRTNFDQRIAGGLFLVVAATFAWFYGGAGWNQDAHYDLARAIVERRAFYIDGYIETGDVSKGVDGHLYINKPPGASVLAALPYAMFRNQWATTAATCGVCGALIAVALYLYGRRRFDARPRDALAIALAISFGTIVFAYSTMLFAHVPAALFLLLAVVLIERRPFLAGLAAGMATFCFYVCGAAALLLAIVFPNRRFIAGAAPFALLLGLYQWKCFGSPFRTALEVSTPFTEKGLLFGVLRMPRLDALLGITVSPYRGLFIASPFLLFALLAFRRRRVDVAVAGIALIFIAVTASFNGWHGGFSFGPRYLLPMIPLLGIPMLATARRAPRAVRALWLAAALASIAINFVATAVDPMPSEDVRDPIRRYLFPAFLHGRIPEETRRAFPWYESQRVDKVALPREAHNLGEKLFGEGKRASVVPIAIWMIVGSAVLFTLAREPSPPPSRPPRTP